MGTLYLFALVVGVGTVAVQFLLSLDKGAGGKDLGYEGKLDGVGDAGDPLGDADGHASSAMAAPIAIVLSLRFWIFGLLAFGLLGSFLHFTGLASRWPTLFTSLGVGLFSGWLASWTFLKLSRSSPNSGAVSGDLLGQVGKVLLPLNAEGRTKVRVQVKGQLVDYVATADTELEPGSSVLVEEVRGDRVHVSPAPAGLRYPSE